MSPGMASDFIYDFYGIRTNVDHPIKGCDLQGLAMGNKCDYDSFKLDLQDYFKLNYPDDYV
jgi:hypothetical protein